MPIQTPDDEYIPRDDESEARRIVNPDGVGEVHYDVDEARVYSMVEFGLGVPDEFRMP